MYRIRLTFVAVLVVLASLVVGTSAATTGTTTAASKPSGCSHTHTNKDFRQYAKRTFSGTDRATKSESRVLNHIIRCQKHPHTRTWLRAERKQLGKEHKARNYWRWQFYALSSYDQSWAYNTGACESGNDPTTATGNGFYGAFQFMASTAYSAGFTVLPHLTSWFEQAVRAVNWRNVAGAGQWPNCG